MKMHPSHRPCLLALAALPARSRTIDLRGNVTHTGNLGSVPKVSIPKYRIIRKEQANIMQIACAVAGSVPKFWGDSASTAARIPAANPSEPAKTAKGSPGAR